MSAPRTWDPLRSLAKPDETDKKVGLILLNGSLEMSPLLKSLWKKACIKIAADGAVSKLYAAAASERDRYVPDMIVGDLDSVEQGHLDFYGKKSECSIMKIDDQDKTDFTKSLTVLLDTVKSKNLPICEIFVLGGYDGRLDHLLANLSTMHMALLGRTQLLLYLVDEKQMSFVLSKGKHRIMTNSGIEGCWCGLVPLAGTAKVTTAGLKWNLNGQRMMFGDLVSTSNAYDGKSSDVSIETDAPLLWMMGIKKVGA